MIFIIEAHEKLSTKNYNKFRFYDRSLKIFMSQFLSNIMFGNIIKI